MPIHHFISYSTVDGTEFALKLADALTAGPPSYHVWLDGATWSRAASGTCSSPKRSAIARACSSC